MFNTFENYFDSIPESIEVMINGNQLKRLQSCKYLGVTYDFNMQWNVHIKNIVSKTKYLVYVFYRLKQTLTKIVIYKCVRMFLNVPNTYSKDTSNFKMTNNRSIDIINYDENDQHFKILIISYIFHQQC